MRHCGYVCIFGVHVSLLAVLCSCVSWSFTKALAFKSECIGATMVVALTPCADNQYVPLLRYDCILACCAADTVLHVRRLVLICTIIFQWFMLAAQPAAWTWGAHDTLCLST